MSETSKKKGNAAIACADVKTKKNEIIVEQGKYGPSNNEINELAGIEIAVEDCLITNENGEIQVVDKTGKVIGSLEKNGTINRKLNAIDKESERDK